MEIVSGSPGIRGTDSHQQCLGMEDDDLWWTSWRYVKSTYQSISLTFPHKCFSWVFLERERFHPVSPRLVGWDHFGPLLFSMFRSWSRRGQHYVLMVESTEGAASVGIFCRRLTGILYPPNPRASSTYYPTDGLRTSMAANVRKK